MLASFLLTGAVEASLSDVFVLKLFLCSHNVCLLSALALYSNLILFWAHIFCRL